MALKMRRVSFSYSTVRRRSNKNDGAFVVSNNYAAYEIHLDTRGSSDTTSICNVDLLVTPAMLSDRLQRPQSTQLGSPAWYRACVAHSKPGGSLAGHRALAALASIKSRSWIRISERVKLTVERRWERPHQ
jgi:hypothetical protein